MIHKLTRLKTKRGHNLTIQRPNKTAIGIAKMSLDNKRGVVGPLLSLHVHGTTDVLASKFRYTVSVVKHHPQDSSYTKRVKRLGKAGQRKLRMLRTKKG